MQRNHRYAVLLWLLVGACIIGSLTVLLDVHLVGGRDYRMLERYAKLETIREIIIEEYDGETDDSAMMDGAIQGMLFALDDPYTFYYTPEDMRARSDALSGTYHGVGMLLQANDAGEIEVVRVYRDSPAQQAGIAAGDVLLEADGEAVSAATPRDFNAAVSRIGGPDGTGVHLKLRRDMGILEFDVIRGEAVSSNAAWSMLEGEIGYISIFQFGGDAAECFQEALESLQTAGMRGLVIDLRNNPGGEIGSVTAIADEILPEGLIVYTENKAGEREEYRADGAYCDVPLAILVNGGSASASEVLAAAVQDTGRGKVFGTQTFGKGVVQAVAEFPDDGSGFQYTFAHYFTPAGRSIHGSGVTPDVLVEGDALPSLSGIPDLANDAQLRTALEWLAAE